MIRMRQENSRQWLAQALGRLEEGRVEILAREQERWTQEFAREWGGNPPPMDMPSDWSWCDRNGRSLVADIDVALVNGYAALAR